VIEDPERSGDVIVFDPVRVTDGIELSDDPVLRFRPRAYSVSVDRRIASREPAPVPHGRRRARSRPGNDARVDVGPSTGALFVRLVISHPHPDGSPPQERWIED
jgi:hypothetical protein